LTEVVLVAAVCGGLGGGIGLVLYGWLTHASLTGCATPCGLALMLPAVTAACSALGPAWRATGQEPGAALRGE
ncbi:MAG: hypothetical protein ACOY3F_05075, partial [Bacillota bacterium]